MKPKGAVEDEKPVRYLDVVMDWLDESPVRVVAYGETVDVATPDPSVTWTLRLTDRLEVWATVAPPASAPEFTRQDHGDIDIVLRVPFHWSPDDEESPAHAPGQGTRGRG